MDLELLNKLSNLSLYGFYDPSKGLVTVHFFNQGDVIKSDIIAYLKRDMSWDIREIVEERSTLYDDREEVVIQHKVLCIEPKFGQFDKFVRSALIGAYEKAKKEIINLESADKMFAILLSYSYGDN
jgi:hypothetical protein